MRAVAKSFTGRKAVEWLLRTNNAADDTQAVQVGHQSVAHQRRGPCRARTRLHQSCPCLPCLRLVRAPTRSLRVMFAWFACRVAELVSCTRIWAACRMPACAAQLGNRLLESDVIRSIEPQHRFKNSTKATPPPTAHQFVPSQRLHNAATLPVVRCPSCGAT